MPPIAYTIFHCVFNVTGVLLNVTLIFLLLTKSPKYMKTYSILVLNLSCADLIACIMDFLTQDRMIALETSLFYISEAPCARFSSWLCFMCQNTLMMVHSQNVWLLLLSFTYRWVLLKTGEFSNFRLYLSLLVIYCISIMQLVSFIPDVIFDEEAIHFIQNAIQTETFVLNNQTAFHGMADLNSWNNFLGSLNVLGPTAPFLIIEAVIIYKVTTFMGRSSMSAETKKLHNQFFKALACQAFLPLLSFICICMFFLPRTGLQETYLLQYGTFALLNIKFTLSPMFDLYFIRAFRSEIKGLYLRYIRRQTIVIEEIHSFSSSSSKHSNSVGKIQTQ